MTLSRRRFVHLLGAGTATSMLAPTVAARGLEARLAERDPVRRGPGALDDLVRLDSNENPNGADRSALAAITSALGGVNRYPDDAADALQAAVARLHGIDTTRVTLGCGSTDVLRACVQAYTSPSRALVTAAPTYESPSREAERVGAAVRAVPIRGTDLRLDLDAMAVAARGAGLVYLCNPNNPTATVHGRDAIRDFVTGVLRHTPDCTILIDEAYHEYVDDPRYESALQLALENPRVVVARTFSKVHGLAGLRIGYAVGRPETIAVVGPRTLDIGINVLGAVAARASLAAADRVDRERALNRQAREFTRRFFVDSGFTPADSQANFLMVDLKRDSLAFRAACKQRGVLIGRVFPPLLTHARVTIGTMDEMQRATGVFRQVLALG